MMICHSVDSFMVLILCFYRNRSKVLSIPEAMRKGSQDPSTMQDSLSSWVTEGFMTDFHQLLDRFVYEFLFQKSRDFCPGASMLVQWVVQVNERYMLRFAQIPYHISSHRYPCRICSKPFIDIAILMCLLACFNLWLVNLPSPNVPVPPRGNITLIKVLLAVSLNSALYIKSLFLKGVLSRGRLPRHNHPTHQLFLLIIMHHASTLSIVPSPSSFLISSVCSFVRLFVHSFLHSFIHSFIRSFVPSFLHSFIHSFFFIHLFSYPHPKILIFSKPCLPAGWSPASFFRRCCS